MAIPVRSLDYELVQKVKPLDQRDGELGLVIIHVDSSSIGVGWMIAQCLEDAEFTIVFGSITFNEHESRYSQPKLELYGVFKALKAECHRLHNIHFRLNVDAGFLAQMMKSPDLPNAAMTRWITYIQLFTFEVNHTLGTAHCIPDGLSHQPCMADDSDYSDGEVDIEDGIKLVKALPVTVNMINDDERKIENGVWVREALSIYKLERLPGEVKVLECCWSTVELLLYDYHRMYTGIGEEVGPEEEAGRLAHQHRVSDRDGEEFWDGVLAYLHLGRLPKSQDEAERIKRRSKQFFLMNGVLWRRNG